MKRRYILLLAALALFTGTVIITGCPANVKPEPQTLKYKVTLKSGEHGSVTVNPALPADGMVEMSTQLSFTAQPDEGYEVDTWTGAYHNYHDNTTATLTVSMNTTVSVTFKRIGYSSEKKKYKVTLVQPEHGTVTVKPALPEDGMIPQYTNLTFIVTPEPGWQVNKWAGVEIWQNPIGSNEVHLSVTEDVTVSVTMIEEGKADATLLQIDSTGRLTGVTDKYRLEGSLVLPDTVTAIAGEALADCTGLTDVTIPDSVMEIGKSAFKNCSSITDLTIGKGLTTIQLEGNNDKKYPFDGCNKIEKLSINCKKIPRLGITSLRELPLGDNVTEINDLAFSGCANLANVTISNSVISIGSRSFSNCTNLTSLTIGDNVTKIGEEAFAYCSNLTDISIPNSVSKIRKYAFEYCSNLTSARFENTVGWKAAKGSVQMDMAPANLENPSTAAYYLGHLYAYYSWTKN